MGRCRRTSSQVQRRAALQLPVSATASSASPRWATTAGWNATDQIAQRAVDEALIGRFGALDDTDGGQTAIATASRSTTRAPLDGGAAADSPPTDPLLPRPVLGFHLLPRTIPVDGDQFEQADNRRIYGWNGSWSQLRHAASATRRRTPSAELRQDRIDPVGLYDTVAPGAHCDDAARTTCARRAYASVRREPDAVERLVAQHRRHARRALSTSTSTATSPENTGRGPPASDLPKLSLIFGPWKQDRIFRQLRRGLSQQRRARRRRDRRPEERRADRSRRTPLVRAKGARTRRAHARSFRACRSSLALWYLQARLGARVQRRRGHDRAEPSIEARRRRVVATTTRRRRWLLLDARPGAGPRARFTDDDPGGQPTSPVRCRPPSQAGVTVQNLGPWTASISAALLRPAHADRGRQREVELDHGVQPAGHLPRSIPQTRIRFDVFNLFDARRTTSRTTTRHGCRGEPADGVNDFHFHPMESRTVAHRTAATTSSGEILYRAVHGLAQPAAGPSLVPLGFS